MFGDYTFKIIPHLPGVNELTHWGRDKMAPIFQATFWNAFSFMKMYKIWIRFHWSLFLRVQLTIFQHWLRWWLGDGQATWHYLRQWWFVYWRIYASLVLNELSITNNLPSEFRNPHHKLHSKICPCLSFLMWKNKLELHTNIKTQRKYFNATWCDET